VLGVVTTRALLTPAAIDTISESAWTDAIDGDGLPRDGAQVADLLTLTQTLAFDDREPARRWEPKRLRFRILAVAGRIVRTGRRRRLRLPRDWPWNHLIDTGWTTIRTA
jgi:Transposase DDE domain group 1